jgi:hypothetical protein
MEIHVISTVACLLHSAKDFSEHVRFQVFTAIMKNTVFWDKNPVRTSEEIHYVFGTELRRLMLCEISDFHSRDYEEFRLMGYKK